MAPSRFQRRAAEERAAGMGGEKISEYWITSKLTRPVLRGELLAILTQLERGREGRKLHSRVWRFLKAKVGSGPVTAAVEPEKQGDEGK